MSPVRAEATARKVAPEPAPRVARARPVPVREADAPRRGLRRVPHALGTLRQGNQLSRIGTLTVVALFASVFGIVIFQTLIVQGQARLDNLATRTTAEEARSKDLRHQVADLESPERIVAAALDRLGMVRPADLAYLTPTAQDDANAAYVAPPPTAAPTTTTPKSSTKKSSGTGTKSSGTKTTPTTTPTTTKKSTTTTTAPTKPPSP
jgi:cell division protein FtsL